MKMLLAFNNFCCGLKNHYWYFEKCCCDLKIAVHDRMIEHLHKSRQTKFTSKQYKFSNSKSVGFVEEVFIGFYSLPIYWARHEQSVCEPEFRNLKCPHICWQKICDLQYVASKDIYIPMKALPNVKIPKCWWFKSNFLHKIGIYILFTRNVHPL